MGEVKREVRTYEVRMRCDKCGKGFMECSDDGIALATYPPIYPHICSKCGYTKFYDCIYPKIIYERIK